MRKAAPGGGVVRSVHVITGQAPKGKKELHLFYDSFRGQEAVDRIIATATDGSGGDSVEFLDGDETSWRQVLDVVATRSLFAPRRVVVVRRADLLKGAGRADSEDEAGSETGVDSTADERSRAAAIAAEVEGYLDDPTPGTTLVLVAPKMNRRLRVWKLLSERAAVFEAKPLTGGALRAEVMRRVRERGLDLAGEGLAELIERVGQDLRRLVGEIEKLESLGSSRQPIDADGVARVLGRGLARPLWEMADALWDRQPDRVLKLAEDAVESGEPPLRILATLHRSLRTLRAGRALQAQRTPAAQLAAHLHVMPFKLEHLQRSLRLWAEPELRGAVAALLRADRTLKSQSGIDPRVILAAAVAAACGGGSVRPSRPGR